MNPYDYTGPVVDGQPDALALLVLLVLCVVLALRR